MEKVKIHRDIARLKNVELFCLDTKTAGPVILCLHGRWGRAETWYDFIRHYGTRYRIIAPDQRGHGLSGKPVSDYTAEEMAADIIELLDYLHIDSIILVGHSMGGRIAGHLAAMYPRYIKAAAILDKSATSANILNHIPPAQLPTTDPMTKDWPLPFSTRSEAMEYIRQAVETDQSYEYFMNSLVETAEGYKMLFSSQAMAANIRHDDSWYHLLPKIKCPVLLIRAKGGEAIPDADFSKMQSMLQNCLAYEMSHPDHAVYLADKDEFYRYFDKFLERI